MNIRKWGHRAIAALLCVCTVLSIIYASLPYALAAKETPGTTGHIADGNTMETYNNVLQLDKSSRYAGRVWSDKSVVTGNITLKPNDDGVEKDVSIFNDSDFLHIFSALGSSQAPASLIPMPLDVVFILDSSYSMVGRSGAGGSVVNNTRLLRAGDALNTAVKMLMTQGSPYNRVALVRYHSDSSTIMELSRWQGVTNTINNPPFPWGDGTTTYEYGYDGTYFESNHGLTEVGDNRISVNVKNVDDDQVVKGNISSTYPATSGVEPGTGLWRSGMTNTQAGIYRGMSILANEQETTIWLNAAGEEVPADTPGATEVPRIPIVIILSDGQPTYSLSDPNWWAPNIDNEQHQGTGIDASYAGNGMLAMATAAYMKREINRNYFGYKDVPTTVGGQTISTEVYTLGLGFNVQDAADKALSYITMDPYSKDSVKMTGNDAKDWWNSNDSVAQELNAAWKDYLNDKNPTLSVNGSDKYTMVHPPERTWLNPETNQEEPVDNDIKKIGLDYVDEFYRVDDPNDLEDTFRNIVIKMLNEDPFLPVEGSNDLNTLGNTLTYMDPIGKYMELKDVKNVLLFGELYNVKKGELIYYNDQGNTIWSSKNDSDDKKPKDYAYYEQYYVIDVPDPTADIANPCYGHNSDDVPNVSFKLSDIRICRKVTDDYVDPTLDGSAIASDPTQDEALYIDLPATALPIQIVNIETDGSGNVTKYTTNLAYKEQSTPFRVFYTVGMEERVLTADKKDVDLTKISAAYLKENRKAGKIFFYSNWYNRKSMYTDYITGSTSDPDVGYTYGDPVLSFSPSEDNRYYVFQKPLPLYAADDDINAGNVLNAGGEVTWSEATQSWKFADGKELKSDKMINLDFFKNAKDAGKKLADTYFYIVIDYFVPPKTDNNGKTVASEPIHYAVARKGSEFGSGLGSDEAGDGAYLCWYDTTTGGFYGGDIEFDMNTLPDGASESGNWVVATRPKGLRVGDMAQSVCEKGKAETKDISANNTDTADTFYLPTISSSSGADAQTIKVNIYLGNNGRLYVTDTELLVTKVVTNNDREYSPDKTKDDEFNYTIVMWEEEGHDDETVSTYKEGKYNAIKVHLDEWPDKWRALIDKIELLTNNQGLLVDDTGKLALIDDKYLYIGNDKGDGNFSYTLFDSDGGKKSLSDNLDKDTLTVTLKESVSFISKEDYDDAMSNGGWSFAKDKYDSGKIVLATVNIADPIGYEVSSDYQIRTTYQTVTLDFKMPEKTDEGSDESGEGDEGGEEAEPVPYATFTLKHGEGLLFTGLNPNTHYIVTETFEAENKFMFKKVTFEEWVWKTNAGTNRLEQEEKPGSKAVYSRDDEEEHEEVIFDTVNHSFSYTGMTGIDNINHVHYENIPLLTLPGTGVTTAELMLPVFGFVLLIIAGALYILNNRRKENAG